MKQYFITGTDTNVGKTMVSAILTSVMKAHYWKPIQSGLTDDVSEQEKIKQLTNIDNTYLLASRYSLKASLSPDQAAELEHITIDFDQCAKPVINNHLIIEGAGGVYVPLNKDYCILDLIERYQMPVIIVARGTLGTINHTLLTIQALRQKKLPIHGVVFSGELNKESQKTIEHWGNVKTLFHVPHFESVNRMTVMKWISENASQVINEVMGK